MNYIVLRRIKKKVSSEDLPVVIMISAYDAANVVKEAYSLGAEAFLRKPIAIEEVEKIIKSKQK